MMGNSWPAIPDVMARGCFPKVANVRQKCLAKTNRNDPPTMKKTSSCGKITKVYALNLWARSKCLEQGNTRKFAEIFD